MKKIFITTLNNVDITETDWFLKVLECLPENSYAMGYFHVHYEHWNESGQEFDKSFVDQCIENAKYCKWF